MRSVKPMISCEHCGKQYKFEGRYRKHIAKAHVKQEEIKTPLEDNNLKSQQSIKQEPKEQGSGYEESGNDSEINDRSIKNSSKGIEFISIQESSPDGQKEKKKFLTSMVRTKENGEREYLCAICQKAYPRPSRLRRHFRKHTGERRTKWFNCSTCRKQFSTEGKLEKHNLRRHSLVMSSGKKIWPDDEGSNSVICHSPDAKDILDEDIKLEPDEAEDSEEIDEFTSFYTEECKKEEGESPNEAKHEEIQDKPKIKKKRGPKPKEQKTSTQKRGGPFKCSFCRLSYSAQKYLDRHLLYHTEKEKPFPCKSCDEIFEKSCELRFHREKVHAQEKCGDCGEMVTSLHDRQRHRTMHAESKYKFECHFCQKRLCRLQSLQHHIERTHMGDKFKCEICMKGFPRVGLLMTHSIAKHNDDKPFSCKMCGFKVNRIASLRSHMITHTKEKNFHCETCGKAFGHSSTFYKHLRMHERTKRPQAKKGQEELARERASRERLFQCEVCAKAFIRMADLKLHLRFHSDVRPYKCTVCPKAFHSSSIMKNHIDRHFGIRKHVCKHCGNTYTDPTGLRRHLVKHGDSAIKTFDCELCGKVFVQKYQLVRHSVTHVPGSQSRRRGGIHPQMKRQEFQCKICEKTYINKTGLKKHMVKHGSGKQIKCPQCNKRYLDGGELKMHLETHVNPIVTDISYRNLIVAPTVDQDVTLHPAQIIILPTEGS